MRTAIGLLLLLMSCAAPGAEIFKCKNADGSTSFSDRACASDATALSVPKSAQKDAPVNWLCEAENARQEPVPDLESLGERQRTALATAAKSASADGQLKNFTERGNIHLCARTSGDRGPVVSETVITPDGQTWLRKDGKTQRLGTGEDVTGGASCVNRITACMRPGDPKMEACVDSIPGCGVGVTGACCPEDCLANYKVSRKQGLPLADAVERMVTLPVCAGAR